MIFSNIEYTPFLLPGVKRVSSSKVFSRENFKDEVLKVAHKVASKSTALARLAKETVNVSYETTLNEGLRAERAIFMSTFSLEDHKEGMEAFSEKRKPDWKNK